MFNIIEYFKKNIFPKIASFIVKLVIITCRKNIYGLDYFKKIASYQKCILLFWHNRIALAPYFLGVYTPCIKYVAVISNSRDGNIIDSITKSFPNGETVRVAHNAKHKALKTAIKTLSEKKVLIITPDGPRGPKYHVKAGAIFASKASSTKIMIFSWSSSRFWQLKTWDNMIFPKPFSKIIFAFKLISLSNKEPYGLKESMRMLEKSMLDFDIDVCKKITNDNNLWPK